MIKHIFSEEIYIKEYGKPKGKGVWMFGDRNKSFFIMVGSDENPLSYRDAKKVACSELEKKRYPIYRTIYLHP